MEEGEDQGVLREVLLDLAGDGESRGRVGDTGALDESIETGQKE